MLGPFKNKSMNMLEKLALWTIMATLYLSLFLVYSDLDINARMVLSVLLILCESHSGRSRHTSGMAPLLTPGGPQCCT
jgi:hypothetical protein